MAGKDRTGVRAGPLMGLVTRYKYLIVVALASVFISFATGITRQGDRVFSDSDPLWHIAAGDLIRHQHSVPEHDPWSFTAGDYRWLNFAWGWEVIFSYIHEQLGWHGALAVNAMSISAVVAFIFATCLLRSNSGLAALIATGLVATLMPTHIRSLQVTNLMTVFWMLLVGSVMRGQVRMLWLAFLPLLMLVWVNCHGGFVVAPMILFAFWVQALHERERVLARWLFVISLATGVALLCNPYGLGILESVWRPLTGQNQFIDEWQPLTLSRHNLITYFPVLLFVAIVPRRTLPAITGAERYLAYFWLLCGLTSIRHVPIFAILAAPILACSLEQMLARWSTMPVLSFAGEALAKAYNHKPLAMAAISITAAFAVWLPSPMAARAFHQEGLAPLSIKAETDFIRVHFPTIRFVNSYDLGGAIIYAVQDAIPVFIDSRVDTAYPQDVLTDYWNFFAGSPGWDTIFTRYGIRGAIILNSEDRLQSRFTQLKGWKQVFRGPQATIYVRE